MIQETDFRIGLFFRAKRKNGRGMSVRKIRRSKSEKKSVRL